MANISSTATRPPQWAADFCERYTPFTFDFAKWLLIVGLILGILAAVTAAIKEFR